MNVNTVTGIALTLSIIFLFNSLNASSIEQKVGAGVLTIVFGVITVAGILYKYFYKDKKI